MAQQKISLPMTGRCQCGKVTYQVTAMPLTLYACHCTECQKQSSSAYGMSMPVPRSGFNVSGELAYWERRSDDGNKVKCAFCPTCGTRIFHEPSRNREIVNVKPGTLDNTNWVKPVGHLWTSSAQKGTYIPNNVLVFSHQPDTFQSLYDAWRALYTNQFE